jgi:hypothetical protein
MDDAARHYQVVDRFFADAALLRKELDRILGDKGAPDDPRRFVWEYWHVPGQFSQQRAPARSVFSRSLLDRFEKRLLDWSARNLGLSAFGGPPWVSCLVDGQFQALHRDSPNGLFAFTFGLSKPDRPRFRGGQTMLARPELLEYWRRGGDREDTADTPLFDEVEPRFNRLLVFDARVPHGVRAIEGPRLAREGRVAIQGWLVPRGCVVFGEGSAEEAAREAARLLGGARLRELRGVSGLVTFRVDFSRAGAVKRVEAIVDLLVRTADVGDRERAMTALRGRLARWRFAPGAGVVVPIVIEDGRPRVARDGAG